MNLFKTVAVAFSMFSAIRMPQFAWNKRNMKYMLCAFPLVGLLAGGLCWGWAEICSIAALPDLVRGAVLCLIPVAVTGGIHLDGYCDTSDALASNAGAERRQEILGDPHIGSFAVIRLCCCFILTFALWTSLPQYRGPEILLSFALSRCLSGLAVATFPLAKDTGLAHTFAEAADRKKVGMILTVASAAAATVMCCLSTEGAFMALAAVAVFFWFRGVTVRKFGGLSGDLNGWFLQTAELWMLAALYVSETVSGLL